jgi:VCBS repeat protein/Big-like domain-containing protein
VSLSFKVLGSALCLASLCAVAPAQTPVSFSTSTQPLTTSGYTDVSNTLAVDLNNDGVPDMVIPLTPSFTTELSVSLSNGDGTFQPQRVVPISSSPIPEGTLFNGDFNNDGKADIGMLVTIASTASNTLEIAMMLGNGDGTFQPTKIIPVGTGSNYSLSNQTVVADFNHDGNQDLAVDMTKSTSGGIYVFPGDGKGGFGTPKLVLAGSGGPLLGGDFDGDANADIAYSVTVGSPCTVHDPPCATDVHVLYGDGKFGFTDVKQYHSAADFYMRSGDLNSDGHTDIFGFDDSTGLDLVALYGQGNRTVTKFSMSSGAVQSWFPAMADVNGDGRMDLVVYGNSTTEFTYNEYVVFLANASGGFTRENVLAPSYGVAPTVPLLVDLNRDNKPDILEPARQPDNTGLTTVVALNETTGAFPSCTYPSVGQGIGVCAPKGTEASPIRFEAAANSFGQIRKIELWVDGTKIGEQYHAWGNRAWLDLSSSFAAGTHNATIFEADVDNRLQKVAFPFTVGAAGSCAVPNSAGVNVCQPTNNGTTQSPVRVQAAAKITGTLARMEVWVDGVKKFTETTGTSFTTSIALGAGKHRFDVYAVNTAGTKYLTTVYTTVN